MEANSTLVKSIFSRGIEAETWEGVRQILRMAATNMGRVPKGVQLADYLVAESLSAFESCGEVARRIHEDGPLAGATIELRKEGEKGFLVGVWVSGRTDYEAFIAEKLGAQTMIVGTNVEFIQDPDGLSRFNVDMEDFIRLHIHPVLPSGESGSNVVASFLDGARSGRYSNSVTVATVGELKVTLSLCGIGECFPPRYKGSGTWRVLSNGRTLSVPLAIDHNAPHQEGTPVAKASPSLLIRIRDKRTVSPFDIVPMGGEKKEAAIAIMNNVASTFDLPPDRVKLIQV